jgi:hypothetical protein
VAIRFNLDTIIVGVVLQPTRAADNLLVSSKIKMCPHIDRIFTVEQRDLQGKKCLFFGQR